MNRREFLKLASATPLGLMLNSLTHLPKSQSPKKNVLIIVFDAFSAYNISLYGYSRNTTPHISRLSKKAVVYHNHYAGGNFTTPGTASLLTGVLPWTHRAFNPKGEVTDKFINKSIFSAFQDYYRIAYTHNGWADILLNQFSNDIEELIPRENLLLGSNKTLHKLFRNDDDIASVSWTRNNGIAEEGYSYSLFLSRINEYFHDKKIRDLKPVYPLGLPTAGHVGSDETFLLEQAIEHIKQRITNIPQPFLGYFHFLPPHDPYRTRTEFFGAFHNDGYKPIEKAMDIFQTRINQGLDKKRKEYDEFILYCDREFNELYNYLETSGVLDNTILVLTSDHGEMNERGISGHSTNALYQPVVRIPLIIFEPGRSEGIDIHENTSAIDVLPTLAHLAGINHPSWAEGRRLPPYNNNDVQTPNIYVVRANDNPQYQALTEASTMIVKDNFKLLYYFGYSNIPADGLIKLYDVRNDPEELNDLFTTKKDTADELLRELKEKIIEVNKPYT